MGGVDKEEVGRLYNCLNRVWKVCTTGVWQMRRRDVCVGDVVKWGAHINTNPCVLKSSILYRAAS